METMTVRSFEERILKGALNMVAPDAEIDGKGLILISSEEVLYQFLICAIIHIIFLSHDRARPKRTWTNHCLPLASAMVEFSAAMTSFRITLLG